MMRRSLCFLFLLFIPSAYGNEDFVNLAGAYAVKRIELAAPGPLSPRPKQRRNVLVFTESVEAHRLRTGKQANLMQHVPHPSAIHATLALQALGQKSGAFGTRIETDPAVFSPERLKGFDAIVLANVFLDGKLYAAPPEGENNRPRPLTDEEKQTYRARQKALLDFVAAGKGLVALHNASCRAIDWPEYNELIGGTHMGHAWFNQRVPIRLDATDHPLNAAFAGEGFTIQDDIYLHGGPYARDKVKVLLSVDVTKAPPSLTADRADHDYPLSWIKRHGKGRLFYTALGDNPQTFENPLFLRHLLDGIRYAAGDLEADDKPTKSLPIDPRFKAMDGWAPLLKDNLDAWTGISPSWVFKDGVLYFDGLSGQVTTKQSYKDFMLRVDWRLPRAGDTGVFIRGRQQQINVWTHPMGSGQLWYAKFLGSPKPLFGPLDRPLVVADRPVGEWNTFFITLKGERLTIELNGQIVIRDVAIELKPEGPISFQNHTDPVEFKSVYIKELK